MIETAKYGVVDPKTGTEIGKAFFCQAKKEWALAIGQRIDRFEKFTELKEELLKVPARLVRC